MYLLCVGAEISWNVTVTGAYTHTLTYLIGPQTGYLVLICVGIIILEEHCILDSFWGLLSDTSRQCSRKRLLYRDGDFADFSAFADLFWALNAGL